MQTRGAFLKKKWNIPVSKVLFHREGTWYEIPDSFPSALSSPLGYVVFEQESDLLNSKHLILKEKINLMKNTTIASIPSFVPALLIPNNQSNNELAEEFGFDADSPEFAEGKRKMILHKTRERNQKVVMKAKENWSRLNNGNITCEICDFSFVEKYGSLGINFIEAHHKTPLSELNAESYTSIEDLAALCSNCHRMIHKTNPIKSVREFRKMVR